MDDSNSGSVWLGTRPTGHIQLNVTRATRRPSAQTNTEAGTANSAGRQRACESASHDDSSDVHPLLMLYPFNPPPVNSENKEAVKATNMRTSWIPEAEQPSTISPALDDLGCFPGEPAIPDGPSSHPPTPALRFSTAEPVTHTYRRRQPNPARRRPPRKRGGLSQLWGRYGFLFSLVLLCDGLCSYQAAHAYRQTMELKTSALTLTPAVFLLLLLPSLLTVYLLRDQRHEVVAIFMLVAGGLYGLLGIGCKVAMLLAQAC